MRRAHRDQIGINNGSTELGCGFIRGWFGGAQVQGNAPLSIQAGSACGWVWGALDSYSMYRGGAGKGSGSTLRAGWLHAS